MNPQETPPAKPSVTPSEYLAGQAAFERGDYRQAVHCLEAALVDIEPRSAMGGEIQMWLVTAYEASGNLPAAIDLCAKLTSHPRLETRQESKRILYILQAPALVRRAEWITKIPDLKDLENNNNSSGSSTPRSNRSLPRRKLPPPPPIDPSEINTSDNGFIVVMLVLGIAILGGLFLTTGN
jgi:tetratricopeptide (TPR) repeat protein